MTSDGISASMSSAPDSWRFDVDTCHASHVVPSRGRMCTLLIVYQWLDSSSINHAYIRYLDSARDCSESVQECRPVCSTPAPILKDVRARRARLGREEGSIHLCASGGRDGAPIRTSPPAPSLSRGEGGQRSEAGVRSAPPPSGSGHPLGSVALGLRRLSL